MVALAEVDERTPLATQMKATETGPVILRVPGLATAGVKPLVLAVAPPRVGDEVVRVTFVARDARVDTELQTKLFRGELGGAKWILPGRVTGVPATLPDKESAGTRENGLQSDTNTLGGTGGPVVSIDTGHMLGSSVGRFTCLGTGPCHRGTYSRSPRARARSSGTTRRSAAG